MYTPGCWWKDVELLEKKTENGGECGEGLPAPLIDVLENRHATCFEGGCIRHLQSSFTPAIYTESIIFIIFSLSQ